MRTRGTDRRIDRSGRPRKALIVKLSINATPRPTNPTTHLNPITSELSFNTTPAPQPPQPSAAQSNTASSTITPPNPPLDRKSFTPEKRKLLNSISQAVFILTTDLTDFFSSLFLLREDEERISSAAQFLDFLRAREYEHHQHDIEYPKLVLGEVGGVGVELEPRLQYLITTATQIRRLAQQNDQLKEEKMKEKMKENEEKKMKKETKKEKEKEKKSLRQEIENG